MRTSSRTQINSNLVSINFLPSEPTITDRWLYEVFEVVPFKTKGGITGYALFPIRHPYANPMYRRVHVFVKPKYKKANISLLYGHAPISSWEGYILENVREDYFFRFLEYATPHMEVAEILLMFEVSLKS